MLTVGSVGWVGRWIGRWVRYGEFVGWLVGGLVGLLGWSVGWLLGWSVGWLLGRWIGWWVGYGQLVGWLVGGLIGWLVRWLVVSILVCWMCLVLGRRLVGVGVRVCTWSWCYVVGCWIVVCSFVFGAAVCLRVLFVGCVRLCQNAFAWLLTDVLFLADGVGLLL